MSTDTHDCEDDMVEEDELIALPDDTVVIDRCPTPWHRDQAVDAHWRRREDTAPTGRGVRPMLDQTPCPRCKVPRLVLRWRTLRDGRTVHWVSCAWCSEEWGDHPTPKEAVAEVETDVRLAGVRRAPAVSS